MEFNAKIMMHFFDQLVVTLNGEHSARLIVAVGKILRMVLLNPISI